jgi:hypothetical protein
MRVRLEALATDGSTTGLENTKWRIVETNSRRSGKIVEFTLPVRSQPYLLEFQSPGKPTPERYSLTVGVTPDVHLSQ